MNQQLVLERILAKLDAATLPAECPDRIWGGPATGQVCSACDERIANQLEIEAECVDGVRRFFHANCFAMLSLERARGDTSKVG